MNGYSVKVFLITYIVLMIGIIPSVNAQQAPIYNNLPSEVRAVLNKSRIPLHGMSAYVHAVGSPRPLLAYKENVSRSPASVMKLVTAYVALGVLGPNHRWPVDILTTGKIQGGRLLGDVFVKGYGAPDFGTTDLRNLLNQLRRRGIHSIQGRLVFDNSFFDTLNLNPGAFDGKPYSAYNAQPDALLFNERITHFSVSARGKRVSVSTKDPAFNLRIVNKMSKVRRGCSPRISISRRGGQVTATFRGKFSSRCGTRRYSRVLMNPANTLYSAIKNIWKKDLKGNIKVQFATGKTPQHAKKLASFSSRTLAQVLPNLGKDSNNVMARQLMLAIGAKRYGAPGTPRKGAEAIGDYLNRNGLHFPELRIENGSGLSRRARISAKHVSDLLMAAYRSPYRHIFMQSLSIAGVDGTMKRRLGGTPVKGRGFFKTGTLRNVRGIAGYVKAADGKTYMVSILQNDPKSKRAKRSHDSLIKWVFWGGKRQNVAQGY
jgi:D-alanyl-D-alanine carboxypeptidase/D-alanyl-D-alanine-endopeptidase (penicillin-binding protein 4)